MSYSISSINNSTQLYTGKDTVGVPWELRPDSADEKSLCSNILCELVFVCSVSRWVVWFSDKVSWERKHVVLQFPVCGPDSSVLVCASVCVIDVLLTCFCEGSHAPVEPVFCNTPVADTGEKIMSSLSRKQQELQWNKRRHF